MSTPRTAVVRVDLVGDGLVDPAQLVVGLLGAGQQAVAERVGEPRRPCFQRSLFRGLFRMVAGNTPSQHTRPKNEPKSPSQMSASKSLEEDSNIRTSMLDCKT